MKTKILICMTVLLAYAVCVSAQSIKGYVFDAQDGEPIMGATVSCGSQKCLTNFNGAFTIKASPGAKIKVSYIGFKDKTVSAQNNMEIAMGSGSYKKMKSAAATTSNTAKTSTTSTAAPTTKPVASTTEMTLKDMLAKPMGCVNADLLHDSFQSIKSNTERLYKVNGSDSQTFSVFESDNPVFKTMSYHGMNFDHFIFSTSSLKNAEYGFGFDKSIDGYRKLDLIVQDFKALGIPMSYQRVGEQYTKAHGQVTVGNVEYDLELKDYGRVWSVLINVYVFASSSTSTSGSSSSTYSSSSSSSSSSSGSGYGRLLRSGTFTDTGVFRVGNNYGRTGQPRLLTFKVYENCLIDGQNNSYRYVGNVQVDNLTCRAYGNELSLCYVMSDDGMIRKAETTNMMGVNVTTIYYIAYGDVTAQFQGNPYYPNMGGNTYTPNVGGYNGGYNGGNTYNTQPRQRNCNHCHGTGWCPTCNGSGWVVNSFGVKGQSPCVNCNRGGNQPTKGKCPLCGGTGKR